MATYTADAAQPAVQPRLTHVGPTFARGVYIADGRTISSGDIHQIVKIPNQCVITSIQYFGRSSGTGGITFTLGIPGNASLFGTITISATDAIQTVANASAQAQLPFLVSLSDDAVNPFILLQMTQSGGTATTTGTFGLLVTYAPRSVVNVP